MVKTCILSPDGHLICVDSAFRFSGLLVFFICFARIFLHLFYMCTTLDPSLYVLGFPLSLHTTGKHILAACSHPPQASWALFTHQLHHCITLTSNRAPSTVCKSAASLQLPAPEEPSSYQLSVQEVEEQYCSLTSAVFKHFSTKFKPWVASLTWICCLVH